MLFRKNHIATAAILLFAIFAAYYAYMAQGWLIAFAFTEPQQWQTADWNDNQEFMIPLWWRCVYFAVWVTPMIGTMIMILCAMRFANLIRKGATLDARLIRALQWVGGGALLAGGAVMFAQSVSPWIVTRYNLETFGSLRFGYEPAEFGIMLLGFGVIIMGWVLHGTLLMKSENEEMV